MTERVVSVSGAKVLLGLKNSSSEGPPRKNYFSATKNSFWGC